jgi:hypothetical protein
MVMPWIRTSCTNADPSAPEFALGAVQPQHPSRCPSVIGSRVCHAIDISAGGIEGPRTAFGLSQSFWNARPPLILRFVDLPMRV